MKSATKRVRIPKYQGVYSRESLKRKHNGKPDRCFDISYKNPQGKLIWEKIGWSSEGYSAAIAFNIRAERLRSLRHGTQIPQKKNGEPTFGDIWDRYDEWIATAKTRPRDDRLLYTNHLKNRFAEKSLSQIGPLDLEKMKTDLTKKGLSPASVKHCLVLVRQMYNKALAWDMWKGENPISKVKMPRLNNRRERFLSKEEAHTLLEELKKSGNQLHDIALLSLHTGMRADEVFSLKWGHVNLENEFIHVADPKNVRPRKAYMTGSVREMFRNRENGHPDDYVFLSTKGEKIKEVSNAFAKVVKRLGFNEGITDRRQKVSFHTLRHTFASWLALRGESILTIKELLGHQTLAMTERYSHLIPDHKRRAVEGIEEEFVGRDSAENI